MATALPITTSTSLFRPVANTVVKAIALCAAAANSVLEVFDGTFGSVATAALGAAGSGYAVNDLFHLVQAGGGVVATGKVLTLSGSAVATFSILTPGTGYAAGTTYATVHDSGSGNDALTITVSTITDNGTLIGKLAAVPNESAPPCEFDCGVLTTNGISVRISGSSAKGHLYYE